MTFPSLSALFGLKSADAAVTAENMATAEAQLAQLTQDKATADANLATAQAALTAANADLATAQSALSTATTELTTAKAGLTTAEAQVKTLEGFKKEQQATDKSEQDESNSHEQPAGEALAGFEQVAASAIAGRKKKLA